MNRQEFMNILSDRIDCLPFEEKKSAINYYDEFFEDAGVENEQSVISSLGSPEFLAENILKSSGCFIESNNTTTYKENFKNNQNTNTQNAENTQKTAFKNKQSTTNTAFAPLPKPKKNNGAFNLLLLFVIVITSPLWFALGITLLSILFALAVTAFALALAFFAVPIITLICAIWLIPTSPFASAFIFGVTAIFIGLLIFLVPAVKWIFKGIGYAVKGIGRSIKNIFGKVGIN